MVIEVFLLVQFVQLLVEFHQLELYLIIKKEKIFFFFEIKLFINSTIII
jgi:hypothetical protein